MPSNPYASAISSRINGFFFVYLLQNPIAHLTGEAGGYQVAGERYAPDVGVILRARQPELARQGYNPNAPTQGTQGASASQSAMAGGRSVLRGGARGAAMGAAGGAIAGNTSEGAEIGAATGAMMGGFKRRDQRQAESDQQTQQAQMQSQQSAAYSRALEACLTGQGYTVR